MSRSALLGWAAVSGAVAVMAGAFGAHGATGRAAEWLRIGAQYQLVHAAAALAISSGFPRIAGTWLAGSGLFAATLYLMAVGGPFWLGAVTPIGGVVMIGGWIALGWTAFRGTRSKE